MHFKHDSYYEDSMGVNIGARFAGVAKHEFGHVVGMYHAESPGTLMQPPRSSNCDPTAMLDAAASYRFEVSALGNGTTHRIAWGAWSAHLDAATNAAPVVSGCTTTLGSITGESSHAGSWTDECVSSNRPATRYARYYTFELVGAGELDKAADLTIELVSSQDTYLYLMNGAGTSGTEVTSNNDSQDDDLGYYNSRITYVASAGTYTIEATTVDSRATGDFTIRIDAALRHPSPPLNVRVIPGNNRLVVLWDPPASNAGSKIAGYRISQVEMSGSSGSGSRRRRAVADPSRLLGADARGYTITNLDNGTEYSVTIKAANTNSDGAPATVTGTPSAGAISIGTVKPNPVVLARKATVKVTTANLVSGGDYSAELVIEDTDKIRFGNCGDSRATQPLPNLGSIVKIQACETGTPTISARLLIGDNANRKHVLAESLPRRVTVGAAPEGLKIDEKGKLNDVFDNNTDREFSVKGSDLLMGTTYGFEISVTSGSPNPLGLDSGCSATSSTTNLETGPTDTEKSGTFRLYACAPVADGDVTVELKLDDVVVATATKTVNVRASVPNNVRANGHSTTSGNTSGRIRIRVDRQSIQMTYKVRYELCTSTNDYCRVRPMNADWDVADMVKNSSRRTFTAAGQTVETDEILIDQLAMNAVYRVEVAAFPVRLPGLISGYSSEPVIVFTSHELPEFQANGQPSRVADIPVRFYWKSGAYAPRICENSFKDGNMNALPTYIAAVEAGVLSWKSSLNWLVANDKQLISINLTKGDCPIEGETGYPGTSHIRLATNQSEFEANYGVDNPGETTNACTSILPASGRTDELREFNGAPIFFRDIARKTDWMATESYRSCANLLHTSAHEAGHALGLSHTGKSYSIMQSSAVTLTRINNPLCAPGPQDIAAVFGTYQSND